MDEHVAGEPEGQPSEPLPNQSEPVPQDQPQQPQQDQPPTGPTWGQQPAAQPWEQPAGQRWQEQPPVVPPAVPPGVPPAAWPAPSPAVVPGPEVLDSGAPGWSVLPAYDGTEHSGSGGSRRRRTAVVAGVVVAALLVSGGAYAAWSRLNGSGPQPADALPASTVAVAEVDLDPSATQKLALFNLLRKFPDATGLNGSDQSFGDWLVRRLSQSGTDAHALDFGRDVQPWLGKRFAVAAVPAPKGSGSGGSDVDGVLVVQEIDEHAAAAAMDKLRAHGSADLGYAFLNGFLVVTPDSAKGAARVVSDAQKASLSTASRFTADVDSLGSDQVITAWADATRAGELLKEQLSSVAGGDLGALDSTFADWKGRWVLGVHATNDSVELRARSFGGEPTSKPRPPVRISHVVHDPIAVVAVSGIGQSLADAWQKTASSPQYQPLLDQARQLGLDLPGDLETLLGDQLTLSLGGTDFNQGPTYLAAATSKDPAAGKAVLDKLLALAGPDGGAQLGLSSQTDGDTLYVGSPDAMTDSVGSTANAKELTSSEMFRAAVANPDTAQTLVYVDLSKVWAAVQATGGDAPSAEVRHLKAVGVSVTFDGADSDATLRLIIR